MQTKDIMPLMEQMYFPQLDNSYNNYKHIANHLYMLTSELFLKNLSEDKKKELTILSLGCGWCHEYIALKTMLPNTKISYIGIDIDQEVVEELKKMYKNFSDIHFFQQDASKIAELEKKLKQHSLLPEGGFKLIVLRHPELFPGTTSKQCGSAFEVMFRETAPYFATVDALLFTTFHFDVEVFAANELILSTPEYSFILKHGYAQSTNPPRSLELELQSSEEYKMDSFISLMKCRGHALQKKSKELPAITNQLQNKTDSTKDSAPLPKETKSCYKMFEGIFSHPIFSPESLFEKYNITIPENATKPKEALKKLAFEKLLRAITANGQTKDMKNLMHSYKNGAINIEIDAKDSKEGSNKTALHNAVINCEKKYTFGCFKELIAHGASVTIPDAQGKTAIDYINEISNSELKNSMLQFINEHNSLAPAAQNFIK